MVVHGNNIVLIGFPGSGKSYIGKKLAEKKGMNWVDVDRMIEGKTGSTLIELIKRDGNDVFCEIETNVITKLSGTNTVYSPGGSVIYNEKAMNHFSYTLDCTIIFLDPPYDVICKRLCDWSERGIVISPGNTLKGLHRDRHSLYTFFSDKRIEVVDEIAILYQIENYLDKK